MNIRWYWLRFAVGPLVTFHLQNNYEVRWNRIYGAQIGSWFVGAVRSRDVPLPPKVGSHGNQSLSEASGPAQSEAPSHSHKKVEILRSQR